MKVTIGDVPDDWFQQRIAELRAAPKLEPDENGCYLVTISRQQAKDILGKLGNRPAIELE